MIAALVALAGTAAAMYYSHAGLALAHYDARAHLVVARRILDSLTPGWQQIGAVWLPLPHVLNMLPVQIDPWYRSGASAIAVSVLSMALASWSLARMIITVTGSGTAAVTGAGLLMLNPNVVYLQSTPMTEPLLVGTTMLALATTARWASAGASQAPRAAGWSIVAACMTRYEAWPICTALIALAWMVLLRSGTGIRAAAMACARLSLYPAIALILFSANARWTNGAWIVQSTFFVPENQALGNPAVAFDQVRESLATLSGRAWIWPAYASAALVGLAFARSRARAPLVLVLALVAAAALPWYAYYHGHPLRIRYGIPLVVACAATTAAGISLLPAALRPLAAAAAVAWTLMQSGPINLQAPLVIESQRDAANARGREAVTAYLRQHWDHTTIMMSMGSLAHYMHDLTVLRIDIRDFLQEGNEQLWVHAATRGPRGFVKWVVLEERSEGGDALYQAGSRDPHFLDGFDRVAEGGGIALYRAR